MDKTEIKLLVDSSGDSPVYELVPAQQIGLRHYKILSSPGLAPGVASGDEIELVPSERNGYRVTKRSGNICVQLFLSHYRPHDHSRIGAIITAIGGWLDGGKELVDPHSGCLLIFTIPFSSGFGAIEKAMLQVTEEFDVDKWMYGNVYDPADGITPLNWWCRKPFV